MTKSAEIYLSRNMFHTPLEAADRGRHFYLSSEEIRELGEKDEGRYSEDYCGCNDNNFPPIDGHIECHLRCEAIALTQSMTYSIEQTSCM
jgi:hypothetical protein